MKFIKFTLLSKTSILLVLISLCFSITIEAQSQKKWYAIQYLKVLPFQESEYFRLEMEVWKKIQEARIKADLLDGWYFYRVVAPLGSATQYNYVTMNVYDSAEKLAGHFEDFGVDYTKILNPEEVSLALRTEEIRELVYEEVWTSVDEVMKQDRQEKHRFTVFNSMKMRPGTDEEEYQRMELEWWKPMHQERMRRNLMVGWGLYTMIIPGGTERNYHWATVDYYDNFMHYLMNTDAILNSIHGSRNAQKYIEDTANRRDLLKAEVRELVDFVDDTVVSSQ